MNKATKVLACVSAVLLLAVGNAITGQSAHADESVNIVVHKMKYKSLSDDSEDSPAYNQSLITNNGAEKSQQDLEALGATPDEAAKFELYTVLGKMKDGIYTDLVALIEWGNFTGLRSAQQELAGAKQNASGQLVLPIEGADSPIKSPLTRAWIRYTIADNSAQTVNLSTKYYAQTKDPTKAFNLFIDALLTKMKGDLDTNALVTYFGGSADFPLLSSTGDQSGVEGAVTFSGLASPGRYFIVEDNSSWDGDGEDNTSRKVSTPMVIDLPLTNPDGTAANVSNTIHVYPKTEYPTGGAWFAKVTSDFDVAGEEFSEPEAAEGAGFALYRVKDGVLESKWNELKGSQHDASEFDTGSNAQYVDMISSGEDDGLWRSDEQGVVSIEDQVKGRYFWLEVEPTQDEDGLDYSLNRWPVYFTITDATATGPTTHAAEVFSVSTLVDFNHDKDADLTGEETADLKALVNYQQNTMDALQWHSDREVDGTSYAGIHTEGNKVNGSIDYTGEDDLHVTLAATLKSPQMLADEHYAVFYDVFTTQWLSQYEGGSFIREAYYGPNKKTNPTTDPNYHMLDIRTLIGSLNGSTFTKYSDAVVGGEQTHRTNQVYYSTGVAGAEPATYTYVTAIHGENHEGTRSVINPVLRVETAETVYVFSGVADADGDPVQDTAPAHQMTSVAGKDVEWLGGFWDGYPARDCDPLEEPASCDAINSQATDSNITGAAHLAWYDDPDDQMSFENGTPRGTQLQAILNVPYVLEKVAEAEGIEEIDTNATEVAASAKITGLSVDIAFTLNPELFERGFQIHQFGQFEWGGGNNEATIVENHVAYGTAGANVIKTDSEGRPLGGAQFVLKNSEGKYLVARTAAGAAEAGPVSKVSGVYGWVGEEDIEQATKLVSAFDQGAGGNIDYGELYETAQPDEGPELPVVVDGSRTGVITVRGLELGTYELEEIRTPTNREGGTFRMLGSAEELNLSNHDLFGSAESVASDTAESVNHTASDKVLVGHSATVKHTWTGAVGQDLTDNDLKGSVTSANPDLDIAGAGMADVSQTGVQNVQAAPFPITGGIGSALLILFGGSGLYYWYKRRQKAQEETA
ncbi:MAG: hypothetical protein LBQ92_05700 [Propionibacteriaceae bacterium]|nr:hypothetical protein [Propionibacteriaceae bacterium]